MRKILFFVVLIFIFLTIMEINNSFGLFETNNTITSESDIAKWQILVNDSDINNPIHFVIDNYAVTADAMVKPGLIAPGTTAYFDLEIDPNDTDVSIRYDITFDLTGLNNESIQITNIEEINNETITQTDVATYTGVIPITNSNTHTVRVYFEWVNDDNNNEADSYYGLDDESEVNIEVSILFSQYLNDVITSYNPS